MVFSKGRRNADISALLHYVSSVFVVLILFVFFVCLFYTHLVTDILATVAPIGVKFYMIWHISVPGRSSPLLGAMFPRVSPKSEIWGPNFGQLTANISKTVSRSVKRQSDLNINSTRAF